MPNRVCIPTRSFLPAVSVFSFGGADRRENTNGFPAEPKKMPNQFLEPLFRTAYEEFINRLWKRINTQMSDRPRFTVLRKEVSSLILFYLSPTQDQEFVCVSLDV